jgi:hypothetical protein
MGPSNGLSRTWAIGGVMLAAVVQKREFAAVAAVQVGLCTLSESKQMVIVAKVVVVVVPYPNAPIRLREVGCSSALVWEGDEHHPCKILGGQRAPDEGLLG